MTIKCDYEYKIKSGVLIIHDLNLGGTSVTDNMTTVLKEIKDSGVAFDDIPIAYKDSDGIFDELEPKKGAIRFIPLGTTVEDEAIQRIKERGLFLWR